MIALVRIVGHVRVVRCDRVALGVPVVCSRVSVARRNIISLGVTVIRRRARIA